MSFASLPDDILLQLFTFLDFHSTISLRQTCRRCCMMSKAKAVWLDSFRWLTRDSEDWRALLDDSPTSRSSQYLEDVVTKMVRFETNWNNGQLRHPCYFLAPGGYMAELVPGGRWLLATVKPRLGTLLYHDLDSQVSERKARVLVDHNHEGWTIWTMDFAVDPTAARFEFDLALELATKDQAYRNASGPRKIAIWRVKLNHSNELVAELTCSFSVFRASTHSIPISLQGGFLLRASKGPSRLPVYTVHRWKGLGKGVVSHSLLLPQAKQLPEAGVRLLPDGRIVSVFDDRIELHAPPREEGPSIPQDMPRVPPQWVFEYQPPSYQLRSKVSRLMYYPKLNSVVFSFHNRGSLFTFRIVTDQVSLPEVTTVVNPVMEDRAFIGLGTSHAIRNTPGQKEAVLVTFSQSAQLQALRSFAGVTNQTSNVESREPYSVTETLFNAPLPSAGGGWEMDEQSGRVLCNLRGRGDHFAVLYF